MVLTRWSQVNDEKTWASRFPHDFEENALWEFSSFKLWFLEVAGRLDVWSTIC